jgi:hypothetical protein
MRETVFKCVAVLAVIGGIGYVVWFSLSPTGPSRDAAAVTEDLSNALAMLKEALALIAKENSRSAGADRLKEGIFQVSKAHSHVRKLRPADKRKAVDIVQAELPELDLQFARLVWSPEVGGDIRPDMRQVLTIINRGTDLPFPPLSQLSGEMQAAVAALSEALGEVKDAASAEAALPALKEADANLDAAQEAKGRLTDEDRATLQSLSKPALEKLKALAAKTLAKPGVAGKIKPQVDAVLAKLTGLAA